MSGMQVSDRLLRRNAGFVAQTAAAGIQGAQPPRISIKDNRFNLIDAAGNTKVYARTFQDPRTGQLFEQPSLDVEIVVVDANAHVSKVFYQGAYSPDSTDAPTCWSDNGEGPSVSAGTPQNSVCSTCPHNAWGSAISNATGKQTKACNDSKKIAVFIVGDPSNMVYQLRIPPASLKSWGAYVKWVTGQNLGGRNADPSDIVTRVSFESQGVLKFEGVRLVEDAEMDRLEALAQDPAKLDMLVGRDDKPRLMVAQAAPAQQVAYQPQQFVQPAATVTTPPVQSPAPTAFAPQNQGAGAFVQPQLNQQFSNGFSNGQPMPVHQPMQVPAAHGVNLTPPSSPFAPTSLAQPAPAAVEPPKKTRAPRQPKAAAPAQAAPVAQGQPFQVPAQQSQPAQAFVPQTNAPAFTQPAAQQPPPAPPQTGGGTQSFGIVQGAPEPDAALMASIKAALGKG